MFRFVSSNGGVQKRQQVPRACDSCRKRKKRCFHVSSTSRNFHSSQSGAAKDSIALPQTPPPTASSRSLPDQQNNQAGQQFDCGDTTNSDPITETVEEERVGPSPQNVDNNLAHNKIPLQEGHPTARFIGDLNPESVFLAATSPEATRGDSNDSVGVWLTSNPNRRGPICPSNSFYASGSLVPRVLVPMLEQESLSVMPATPHREALSKVYFEKIYPIFPVVDIEKYHNLSPTDYSHILIIQGICLAASKNFGAKPHLILENSPQLLNCREFGNKLAGAMRLNIEMGLVTDRIVVIQALALLSQFIDNPVGEDLSSQFCSRAVHHVHSLGLHVQSRHEGQEHKFQITLLCCVWAIDRLNAAMYGRPVMMHERDIRTDFDSCFAQQQPTFRVFLQIILLLDQVISLYRPTHSSTDLPYQEFLAFEDAVSGFGANIGGSALATLEILYHSVAILSCRSKTWIEPQRSSVPYMRQSISTSILSSTTKGELQGQLVLFPFIPYALSLCLSMVYKEMRYTKLPIHRARSRTQFQAICEALAELRGVFWSAHEMAEMGKKLLEEMDRVYSQVSSSDREDVTTANHEQLQNQQIQEFDPLLLDSLGDIDPFGMFDPAFDLEGFDACLESNLNPAFPMGFQ